ncbi:Golgi transport complex subunit 5-domain-containing protein [Phlebopus sp. FC_14]|nr:Golgi transport complex subunit 5-domain-containing protein [Phlebopus sp. FC_14]
MAGNPDTHSFSPTYSHAQKTDYSVFAIPDFDANEYANAILAGEPYPPATQQAHPKSRPTISLLEPAKEDISLAISKLDLGIEDVSKQIKTLVTTHHEDLLQHASNVSQLSGSLTSVRRGLDDVESSIDKLRQKIRVPYRALQTHVTRLHKIQQANDALRRTARFAVLAKRLEAQMNELGGYETTSGDKGQDGTSNTTSGHSRDHQEEKERTIAKAALSITELTALLDGPDDADSEDVLSSHANEETKPIDANAIPLRSVNAAAAYIPFISNARTKVEGEMEAMVIQGLTTLDQSLLASSLQTAYNLRVLPTVVQGLIRDLSEAVEERIRNAFDLSRISKEIVAKEPPQASQGLLYKSRVRTEPTNVTAPQFAAALWTGLESLVEEMAGCCIKVYTLEKVLNLKKDPLTGVSFMDESMKVLENKPSSTFWASLGKSLEKNAREAAKGSTFLQQTLSSGHPRLLRLFHEFFASIAVHTDTVYTQSHQSPETILVLRALSSFEALYLSRSSTRLNEAVAQAFSGGFRAPPGTNEGVAIVRTVTNELDSARFDPLLVRGVAKNVATSLESVASKADGLIVTDRSAVTLLGPMATPQQITNGQVASCLYHCWIKLDKLMKEHAGTVSTIVAPGIAKIRGMYDQVVDPLLAAIRRDLAAVIARVHRLDLQKTMDPMSGMAGTSLYMKDLVDKLTYVKTGILSNFAPEATRTWILSIVKYVIKTFVLHVSIAKPLGESGKLQLTTDMTELEFALSAFLVETPQSKRGGNLESIGEEYKTLRAMRPLLFLENSSLATPECTVGLSPLVVLHHILVRSPLPLPHTIHGWQEAEYVRWIDEHSSQEAWSLVESSIAHWEKRGGGDAVDVKGAEEYIRLARSVLASACGQV